MLSRGMKGIVIFGDNVGGYSVDKVSGSKVPPYHSHGRTSGVREVAQRLIGTTNPRTSL